MILRKPYQFNTKDLIYFKSIHSSVYSFLLPENSRYSLFVTIAEVQYDDAINQDNDIAYNCVYAVKCVHGSRYYEDANQNSDYKTGVIDMMHLHHSDRNIMEYQ